MRSRYEGYGRGARRRGFLKLGEASARGERISKGLSEEVIWKTGRTLGSGESLCNAILAGRARRKRGLDL